MYDTHVVSKYRDKIYIFVKIVSDVGSCPKFMLSSIIIYWFCLSDKDYASTSRFQEQISKPLCVHNWMLLVHDIYGLVYLMWMLTIVIYI